MFARRRRSCSRSRRNRRGRYHLPAAVKPLWKSEMKVSLGCRGRRLRRPDDSQRPAISGQKRWACRLAGPLGRSYILITDNEQFYTAPEVRYSIIPQEQFHYSTRFLKNQGFLESFFINFRKPFVFLYSLSNPKNKAAADMAKKQTEDSFLSSVLRKCNGHSHFTF